MDSTDVGLTSEAGLEALVREGIAVPPAAPRAMQLPHAVHASGSVSDLIADQRR
ncbi:hypothetical protein [Brachybacterium massiliense]|uniref:hypothetical protein n=1 Tax=Brachybacterium massiliense TaxID=1755098 RepID=UPI00148222EE|nr:hypothetical protein [Brachybacterium massiliense]